MQVNEHRSVLGLHRTALRAYGEADRNLLKSINKQFEATSGQTEAVAYYYEWPWTSHLLRLQFLHLNMDTFPLYLLLAGSGENDGRQFRNDGQ